MPDEALLELRLSELGVAVAGTWLEERLATLNEELRARGLLVRAHAWISDEWFSPDNTPGIAFPFYLAHPRLARLEKQMMLEVEGGTRRECMQILRHEAGHVVQHAFGLHRRRRWQELFGRSSKPYPSAYKPDPASKDYVQHLRRWYAQSHPDEDFAETFAVWLTPRSNWRKRYADWPALEKLRYVDALMSEIAGKKPILTKRIEVDSLNTLNMTLAEHYEKKRAHWAVESRTPYDRALKRIFSTAPRHLKAPAAAAFLRRNRAAIRALAAANGEEDNTPALDSMLDEVIARCRTLQLRAPGAEAHLRKSVAAMLDAKAETIYRGSPRQWYAL